jgi:acetylornithine deacetylase/succinyl-diaminopimelate desuccinylase-like protein
MSLAHLAMRAPARRPPVNGHGIGRIMRRWGPVAALLICCAAAASTVGRSTETAPELPAADRVFAREVLAQLVGLDTTAAHGTAAAARVIAARLTGAGFAAGDVQVLAPPDQPTRANVVVRLRGAHRAAPLLVIGHLDVVEAPRETWSVDPFHLTEKDGFFYGRGVLDLKGEDTAILSALVRLKRERVRTDRDIIVAFTADEEAGTADGADWLLRVHRDLLEAGMAINPDEGAAGLRAGKRVFYGVQTSTKRYITYQLRAVGKSGHTAIPQPDNAIYKLAAALTRLVTLRFPIEFDATTRAFFARTASTETGQTRADMIAASNLVPDMAAAERLTANPERNAHLRTTCVATMLKAGTVENALADDAEATIQCRVLPQDTPEFVKASLVRAVADPSVSVTTIEPGQENPESPLRPQLLSHIEAVVHSMWPGVVIVPALNIGASDSVYTRAAGIPTYGLCSIFYDLDDDRAHADDERIGVANFYEGVEFTYRLLKALSRAGSDAGPTG